MVKRPSRKKQQTDSWPQKVRVGRVTVTVYRRKTPSGGIAYMVANYSAGKRRYDCYPTADLALEEARKLARQLSEREVLAASLTNREASDYSAAIQALKPFNVAFGATISTLAECLKLVGDLPNLHAAAKFYAARHKQTVSRPVADVVPELLKLKDARKASVRYLSDLRYRLAQFADALRKNTNDVTTAEIQEWLDSKELSSQSYMNYRRVINLFFEFAVARGYAADNPVSGVERIKIRNGEVAIFTPEEMTRLLAAASPEFVPCLAIGGFAGLRSAEIERLEWADIDFEDRHIIVGASRSKTASRRVVPISKNLSAWLAPYTEQEGLVWKHGHDAFYNAQQETAAATEINADRAKQSRALKPVKWKSNAMRHSYATYRFALIGDAGRIAGELGNSAAIVHRHYRELAKSAEAERWFEVVPND